MKHTPSLNALFQRVSEGDQEAFKQLYLHYYNRLFRFAMLWVHTQESAEDVVADVFFNLWKNRALAASIVYPDTYMYKAVRNGCGNLVRSSRYKQTESLSEVTLEAYIDTQSPDNVVQYNELNIALTQAVNALPERCRLIYKMAREDNLHQTDIAIILNLSPSTVENQMTIANRRIQQAITPFLEKIAKK